MRSDNPPIHPCFSTDSSHQRTCGEKRLGGRDSLLNSYEAVSNQLNKAQGTGQVSIYPRDRMHRINGNHPSAQAPRQLLAVKRYGKLRLFKENRAIIGVAAIEICKCDAFWRYLINACTATQDYNSSRPIPHD